ncbi:AMP-binding protein [Nocardioides zhouii]|uniref:ATP-dependent acyl-CoA ligase n=1 Tax=Nocardioides zhouii TaxID=1168729 RepID=A0A4Q2SNX9_9ACTN|nr:AMP-binding protein [Nocardioides zhouii]RYC05934.1 ATP-dependent acyl-CoA ligase [Nocardioides zhouii]
MEALLDALLPQLLRERAARDGDREFFRTVDGVVVTYAEAYARACAVANGMTELGIKPGECVVIMADNTPSSICTWLATSLAAAVEVAVNTGYRGRSLEHVLQNSQARVMYVEEAHLPRILEVREALTHLEKVIVYREPGATAPLVVPGCTVLDFDDVLGDDAVAPDRTVGPQDIASVVYTSGTTGPAKGVRMPHGQVRLFSRLGVEGARLTADDAFYCFIPLFHVAGKFIGIMGSMMAGGRVVLDTRFSVEAFLPRVREHGCTVALLHGPLVEMVHQLPPAADDADNPMTRIMASPFPAHIALDFQARFGIRGIETWGMTEVTIPIWQPFDEPLRVGSCGRLREEHFELRIVDPDTDEEQGVGRPGEMVLRPRNPFTMMQGYLHMPDVTVETWRNLWFHTGDIGYVAEDGYVYFVDRVKERIRRRAENISSFEIEAAALTHAAVLECAAVGVPSEFEGDDDVLLCVVLVAEAEPDPQSLLAHLAAELPHFMVPRYLNYLDVLPRTPTGKPQKVKLRDAGVGPSTWDRKASGVSLRQLAQEATQ